MDNHFIYIDFRCIHDDIVLADVSDTQRKICLYILIIL
jgi:hypothetical protein